MREASELLDPIPLRLRAATAVLLSHAVIKNAGVYRRRAIDTLRAGGWADRVIPALEHVLRNRASEPWLRCRVLFTIGFLQERGDQVQQVLVDACESAWSNIRNGEVENNRMATVRVVEMHAALFSVGDAFGPEDASAQASDIRERLDDLLDVIVQEVTGGERRLVPVGRALAYLLGVTAHVRIAKSRDMLDRLSRVADQPTKLTSEWGLRRIHGDIVLPAHAVKFEAMTDLDDTSGG